MKTKHLLLTFILGTFAMYSSAQNHTLKSVMQGLRVSMNQINDGIFNENYSLIMKAAKDIANHPKPKSQMPTVIKTLGFDMLKFKKFDGKVHDPATNIIKFAKNKNMKEIMQQQTIIIRNCVACHQQYRKVLSKALNKQ